MSLYPSYNYNAKIFLYSFLDHFYPENKLLIRPIKFINRSFTADINFMHLPFEKGFILLNKELEKLGEVIPSMFKTIIKFNNVHFNRYFK
jgi:hypothetical protein